MNLTTDRLRLIKRYIHALKSKTEWANIEANERKCISNGIKRLTTNYKKNNMCFKYETKEIIWLFGHRIIRFNVAAS